MKPTVTQLRYLLAIYRMEEVYPKVRCIDLAIEMGVARATVSRIVQSLIEKGWLCKNHQSLRIADCIKDTLRRYLVIREMLMDFFDQLALNHEEMEVCVDALLYGTSLEVSERLCQSLKKIRGIE